MIILNAYTCIRKLIAVRGGEGHHAVCRVLDRPVASKNGVSETQTDFTYYAIICYHQGGDEIVTAIASQLAERYLSPCKDDRLIKPFEHE